ncbi:hypothetical protein VE01_10539 [Pseudogymnoascus verrucosus]|uniref:Uncharacterized protein n=1 Tax=Pseudogymnoascus verrucosus TaxID=342668 RepID=A0A1B8G6H4_9PEZI|nr:uncharacterized protein VE01_10539 [Pseudogymnoascus verrucosus]OBT91426.1 hypothetical protein VE01_10539 [Pseudogymnoascus verrucosus]
MSGRMLLPDIAHERLVTQMSECSWNKTMLNQGDVAPFQIDGNFPPPGNAKLEAAYTGELNKVTLICLLPSIPAAWVASGGGQLKTATITSELENDVYVTIGQTPIGSNEDQSIKVAGLGTGAIVNLKGKKGTKFTVTSA